MPHVTIQYTANLDPDARIDALCATLAEVICAQRDDGGQRLYPIGGTRVLAYPSTTCAVADGGPDRAFCYVNVRIAPGRLAKTAEKCAFTAAPSASPVACTRSRGRPGAMRTLT